MDWFAFAEQMILAAERSGVDPQLADRLVRQTFLGAARMLSEDDRDAAALKRAVTSPNGTTQAGLTALEDPSALPAVVPETLRRAHARALELAAEA
ncbi:pyrroline-5-carboxylate reductase family protein [Paracoccus pantotrophus]|uniref:pyrroline-5-carboxylate reductase family protein n=1 Tax=Paracoccus pantotrophus TaxID=82367 RepID=UPI0039BEF127